MLEPIWMQFSRRVSGHHPQHSSLARMRAVRLHAERLEERLLMAADDPATDLASGLALTTIDRDQAPIVAAAVAAREVATATASSADAIDPGWEQFGSKAAFDAWLIEAAVAQYGQLFGQKYGGWHPGVYLRDFDAQFFTTNLASTSADYSNTNLQVAGVDEADLIETDGSYLYIISGEDLVIVQVGVGDELRVMSRVHIGGRPVGMFLSGDRLAIVSDDTPTYDWGTWGIGVPRLVSWDAMYVHEPTPPKTTLTILDVGNRAAPALVQKAEMDGQLIASRVVDGELRLVLNNQFRLPAPISKPIPGQVSDEIDAHKLRPIGDIAITLADRWWPGSYGQEYIYETQDEYLARVRDTILDSFLPQMRNLDLDGEVISVEPLVDPATLFRPDSVYDQSITTIATFDLDSNRPGPMSTASVMTYGNVQIHATTGAIYLFSQKPFEPNETDFTPRTRVWKFDMDGGRDGVQLAAKGSFTGTVLNQFAADERDGFLRVVTEQDWSSGHALHVLQQTGRWLEVVGSIDGIATGERLYSVRFVDERAFFVTFRQIDPLFAVDLSDPTNPRLLGELHIPGYSDYLQPIDDTHLLAIGRGADEATGLFEELQVSIFDVSDVANPQLLHRYSFEGGRGTETPVTGNRWTRGDGDHHAVSYFAAAQTLAFPVFNADTWNFETGAVVPNGGLHVFKIDLNTGFTPLAVIEHDTHVERSLRVGDHLYAISSGAVTVHDLTDPTVQLGEVSIAASPDTPLTELVAHAWQQTFETAIAELSIESETSEPVSERGTDFNPSIRTDWIPTRSDSISKLPTDVTVQLDEHQFSPASQYRAHQSAGSPQRVARIQS